MIHIPLAKRKQIYIEAAIVASYQSFFHYWRELLNNRAGFAVDVDYEEFWATYPETKLFAVTDKSDFKDSDINEIRITALCLCAAMCE